MGEVKQTDLKHTISKKDKNRHPETELILLDISYSINTQFMHHLQDAILYFQKNLI